MIILFRAAGISKRDFDTGCVLAANVAVIIAVLFAFYHAGSLLTPSLRCVVMIVALTITNILLRYHQETFRTLFLVSVIIISVIGGALVNPVSSGLGTLYDADVIQEIDSINRDSAGAWAVSGPFPYANLPAVAGAKCVTALATYPDFRLWKELGLTDQESEMVWNRYAHVELKIGKETRVEQGQTADVIHVYVTLEDLQKLGVQYILSTEALLTDEKLTCLYARNGFQIYQLASGSR